MRRSSLLVIAAFASAASAHADRRVPYQQRGDHALGVAASGFVAPDVTGASATLHFDWTVADGFSLGARAGITAVRAADASAQLYAALVEPAYHARLAKATYAFVGVGIGTGWARELGPQAIVTPRIGLHLLVGKRGVLAPALAVRAVTHGRLEPADDDAATRALTRGIGLELGYALRW